MLQPLITIAPYNSGLKADLYTLGISDQHTIQYALDYLPSDGGTVLLLAGTYSISSGILFARHNIQLLGAGIGVTKIVTTSPTFDAVTIGNRQNDGVMRNFNKLVGLTVSHAGGASTKTCVKVDGGGRGTRIQNVQTNEGGYGFQFIDLDRCFIDGIEANNPRTASIICQTGLENTFGTVKFQNISSVLSDANSSCFVFDTLPTQTNPNRFDRINIDNALFFSTNGVSGTKGLVMKVGASSFKISNSLFESPKDTHIELDGQTQLHLDSCTFMQNSGVTTNGIAFKNNTHKVTVTSCRFQQMTNVFNGISGYSQLMLQGLSENQGNITNVFTGQFGFKGGTDVLFANEGNLNMGGDNERYDLLQGVKLRLKKQGIAPDTDTNKGGLFYKESGNHLVWKDSNGQETNLT